MDNTLRTTPDNLHIPPIPSDLQSNLIHQLVKYQLVDLSILFITSTCGQSCNLLISCPVVVGTNGSLLKQKNSSHYSL